MNDYNPKSTRGIHISKIWQITLHRTKQHT